MTEKKKRKREDSGEESYSSTVDRISQLPDPLIHHILSFLQAEDAACTSILSKAWYHNWSTSPTWDFNLRFVKDIREYLNLVDESLQRRHCLHQQVNSNICKFRMHSPSFEPLAPHLGRWVGAAVERNVQNLELQILSTDKSFPYSVPETLLSAKSLTTLRLSRFTFEGKCGAIQLFQLRKLRLDNCLLDEQLFQNLAFSLPLIEDLALSFCKGLKSLRLVPSLLKLKRFHLIMCYWPLSTLQVEAPNLHTFELTSIMLSSSCKINFAASFIALKELKFGGQRSLFTEEQFQNILSLVPNLEALELSIWYNLERLKISSEKLKRLKLSNRRVSGFTYQKHKLSVAVIETPNLLSFYHRCFEMPFINTSTCHLRHVHIEFLLGSRDMDQFAKLKNVLSSHSKDLKFVLYSKFKHVMIIHEKLGGIQLSSLSESMVCISSMSVEKLVHELSKRIYFLSKIKYARTLTVACISDNPKEFVFQKMIKEGFQHSKYLLKVEVSDQTAIQEINPTWKFFVVSHSAAPYRATWFRITF